MSTIVFLLVLTVAVVAVAKYLNHLDRKAGRGKFSDCNSEQTLPD